MRVNKKHLLSCILMILAICACGLSTYAWMAENRDVDSENLNINATSSSNIVISNDVSEISKGNLESINGGSPFSISSSVDGIKYAPATSTFGDFSEFSTGLKFVVNTSSIDINTGIKINSAADLRYELAENSNGGAQYYVDVPVLVASHGKALGNAKITASISSATKIEDENTVDITSGSLMATSIDIYQVIDDVLAYRGTLNVAGLNASLNDYTTKVNSIYILGGSDSTGVIPLNTSGYLSYVLRCYFDGALLSGEGQAYINSQTLDPSKVTLGISFTAEGNEID